jgi:hypothetical protein
MNITREQLLKIIKEEYASSVTTEGLHDEGLREMIADFVAQEVSGWHDVAKADLHKHVAENGFDISEIVFNALGGGMQEELSELGPNTVKTDFPAGAASEYPKMLNDLYDSLESYEARYGKSLPNPKLMEDTLDAILRVQSRLKRLEESLY